MDAAYSLVELLQSAATPDQELLEAMASLAGAINKMEVFRSVQGDEELAHGHSLVSARADQEGGDVDGSPDNCAAREDATFIYDTLPPILQPAAHAFKQAVKHAQRSVGLKQEQQQQHTSPAAAVAEPDTFTYGYDTLPTLVPSLSAVSQNSPY